jgi:hypothetical protein
MYREKLSTMMDLKKGPEEKNNLKMEYLRFYKYNIPGVPSKLCLLFC